MYYEPASTERLRYGVIPSLRLKWTSPLLARLKTENSLLALSALI